MKKRFIYGSVMLMMLITAAGCGGAPASESVNPSEASEESMIIESSEEVSSEEIVTSSETSSKDTTDYGRVYFKPIYIYADEVGNNFDEVPIKPIFTIPEACGDEVFEYEINDDSICYIEDNRVFATGISGSTKVTAKSQHLKGSFYVNSSSKYNNALAFSTAKSLAKTAAKADKEGTTLFVGDSFFEFWRNKTGVDEIFSKAFEGYDVANVGISGTQAREWRSLVKKLIDPYKPENIVLNIGINDVDDNNEDGASTAQYIMSLCEDIWMSNPDCNIYYCSITRCAGYFSFKWTFHSESNEIMKANAESNEKLHYLDIMERFGNDYASYEQSDGLHPNTAGYEIFKDVIKTNVPLKTL